jgi:hypothetical protein
VNDMTELQQAAAHINTSTTGAVATVAGDHVSVEVPGLQLLPGGKVARIFTTEKVRSLRAAIRLVLSME